MASVTRKKRPAADQRRSVVEQGLLVALKQLLESGRNFTELSVEELARTAGISRSYFYMNFRDKSALVKVLMARVGVELKGTVGLWFQQPEIATRADLKRAMVRLIEAYEKHQAILRAVAETSLYDPEISALYRKMMEEIVDESRQVASRLRRSGKAVTGLSDEVAEILTWMPERICGLYLGGPLSMSKSKLAETMAHIIWCSFLSQEPTARSAPTSGVRP